MATLIIETQNASPEFRKGFLAALSFLSGSDTAHLVASGSRWAQIEIPDREDNATYRVKRGEVRFHASGVEI